MGTRERGRRVNPIVDLVPYHHLQYEAPCNLRCFYCYEAVCRASDPDKMTAAVETGLRRAKEAGYRVVAFGAGELVLLPGWEAAVRRSTALGFEERLLVSNLTLLDEGILDRLVAAGMSGVAGTFFATNDADAARVAGRSGVFSRQVAAARRIGARPALTFTPHLMLTRAVASDPLAALLALREQTGIPFASAMISAIEPLSDAIRESPDYTDGLAAAWEEVFRRADAAGLRLVVQNIPACRLGEAWAHRSFVFRKRVARALEGWPRDAAQARRVSEHESLYTRLAPEGACRGCPLHDVCHRSYAYPSVRRPAESSVVRVVERVLAEERVGADPAFVAETLRRIAARTAAHDDPPWPPTDARRGEHDGVA